MEVSTLEYVIDPIYMSRLLQLLPAYYKINRRNGINTYQGSVLFTIYNEDVYNTGMRVSEVEASNPMQRDSIKRNLLEMADRGYLTVIGKDTPRSMKYVLTVEGVRVVKSILRDSMGYKGQVLHTEPILGTFTERVNKNKEKAIQKMVNRPHMVQEALRRIQEAKDKEADNEL